jgi:hypothetical protein
MVCMRFLSKNGVNNYIRHPKTLHQWFGSIGPCGRLRKSGVLTFQFRTWDDYSDGKRSSHAGSRQAVPPSSSFSSFHKSHTLWWASPNRTWFCFEDKWFNRETNRFRNIVSWAKIFYFPVCVLLPLRCLLLRFPELHLGQRLECENKLLSALCIPILRTVTGLRLPLSCILKGMDSKEAAAKTFTTVRNVFFWKK